MKNVQSVIKMKYKTEESRFEFERLMEKLFIYHGNQNGYLFEPTSRYGRTGIHGVVRENFPGIRCPAAFYFLGAKDSLDKEAVWQELKKSLETLLESKKTIQSYVLVTPYDLEDEGKKRLDETRASLPADITVHQLGPTAIQELLVVYPALKKYYYSLCEFADDPARDFIAINKKYRQRLRESLTHLHFVGLPTGSYQKQQLLIKPQLEKVYIPLGFSKKKDDTTVITLDEILKKSDRVVLLGNPGSGKTTLAKYLALIHCSKFRKVKKERNEEKTPFIIPIREFVRKQKEKLTSFDFIDYLKYTSETNYGFNNIDRDFFIALLELGKSIMVFDGLDEITSEQDRFQIIRDIQKFSQQYPDSPIWITSRIVGYAGRVTLNTHQFDQYYLAPLSRWQARRFVKKWYENQFPLDKTLRSERIQSLKRAIEESPGVRQLRSNPLLLTMMTLIHQFEGTLPDNRARLYEKCIELLLKTWQDQKYTSLGIKNPLEERGLKYDIQLRLLSAAAFHILKKTLDSTQEDLRVISEKELFTVLFENRFDKRRMTEKKAGEDIRVFLDYIRERAGLLVEIGRNEKGENLFSFVHLSFIEYLAAYKMAVDRSKSQEEHIRQLVQYLEMPASWEPTLLALHLFSRSTDPSFIDSFTEAVFKKLNAGKNYNGWIFLGRAVRDNINFAPSDIKKILRGIVNIWLEEGADDMVLPILKEIVLFSVEGKKILRDLIKETLENYPADQAFKALSFYKNFYKIDSSIPRNISKNKDYESLLAYLPIYRGIKLLKEYIKENLDIRQWYIYFNSSSDKTLENLDCLLAGGDNTAELRGYLLSSWRHIFNRFHDRSRFLEQKKNGADLIIGAYTIRYNFANYADVHFPLTLFQPFLDIKLNYTDNFTMTIKDRKFISEDRQQNYPLNDKLLEKWVNKTVQETLEKLENDLSLNIHLRQDDEKHLMTRMSQFGRDFIKNFTKNLNQNFIRDFIRDITKEGLSQEHLRHFIRSLHHYITGDFIQGFLTSFNRDFIRNLNPSILRKFSLEFTRYLNFDLHRDFIQNFLRDRVQHMRQFLKKKILVVYRKRYNKELKWKDLTKQDYERLYNLYVDEIIDGNTKVIDAFFNHLYDYLFYDRFEVSFECSAVYTDSQSSSEFIGSTSFPVYQSEKNPLLIPFTFGFLLAANLNHYLIHILAELNTRFYINEELDTEMISEAVDDYCGKNPFILYLTNFCWDFYARDFNTKYQDRCNDQLSHLRLASFIVNAAKVSLTTGMPCKGEHWEKILKKAEGIRKSSLLVNISLTLYKLCNFQEREKTSSVLKDLLEKLKREYPEDYQLLGLNS